MDLVLTQNGLNQVFTARIVGADLSASPTNSTQISAIKAGAGHELMLYGLAIISDDGKAWVQIVRVPKGFPDVSAIPRGWFKPGAGVPYIRQMAPPFAVSTLFPGDALEFAVSAEGAGGYPNLGIHLAMHVRKYQQNPTFEPQN